MNLFLLQQWKRKTANLHTQTEIRLICSCHSGRSICKAACILFLPCRFGKICAELPRSCVYRFAQSYCHWGFFCMISPCVVLVASRLMHEAIMDLHCCSWTHFQTLFPWIKFLIRNASQDTASSHALPRLLALPDITFHDTIYWLQYVFMDMTTYEETRLARDESWAKYMKEGLDVSLVVWNDKVNAPCYLNAYCYLIVWCYIIVLAFTAQCSSFGQWFFTAACCKRQSSLYVAMPGNLHHLISNFVSPSKLQPWQHWKLWQLRSVDCSSIYLARPAKAV